MAKSFSTIAILALVLFASERASALYTPKQKLVAPTFGIKAPSRATFGPLYAVDDDWEGVDLVKLLGTSKVKKLQKKRQRARNNAINDAAAELALEERRAAHAGSVVAESPHVGKALRLIIAGAPASGKGTQCAFIKEKYGVVHLSTGDMLRAAVVAGTDVGKQAKDFMDSGKLVPDEVIIRVVTSRLEEADCKTNGWLLDGFPRTKAQAQALADAGVSAECFISLNVPDDVLIERVVGRRTDPVTGKIYHMTFSPPPVDVMDRLEQRSDDTEEKCRVRLEQFHANVEAVKGSYKDVCVEIDGTLPPDEVQKIIASFISSKVQT